MPERLWRILFRWNRESLEDDMLREKSNDSGNFQAVGNEIGGINDDR